MTGWNLKITTRSFSSTLDMEIDVEKIQIIPKEFMHEIVVDEAQN